MRLSRLLHCLLCVAVASQGLATEYWRIDSAGAGIVWHAEEGAPHDDHVEMAGRKIACVARYGVASDKTFHIEKSLVWPMLRTIPNDTHASLIRKTSIDIVKSVNINERPAREQVETVRFDGILRTTGSLGHGTRLSREYLPSADLSAFVERYVIVNGGESAISVEVPEINISLTTPRERGIGGEYRIEGRSAGHGTRMLQPGDSITFSFVVTAGLKDETIGSIDADHEVAKREALLEQWRSALVLETPDAVLNKMFEFSKIRACESIFQTKSGPMHAPGGETYYAAIWANDQAEYANPFFPFVGYDYANASADNSFRLFARYMNNDFKPIPSSIIAEGDDYWNGAGDRGDAAMIAYGAGRYALARGDRETADGLWPLLEWCLEYCRRNLNEYGVVCSDADELENRFPAGDANLCTSSLYYDALLSAASLARELKKPDRVGEDYKKQAARLKAAIDSYFAGPVEDFDTYAYYKGNKLLRSWICIPLTVGIYDKAEATVKALFSDKLWSDNGLLTQSLDKTYWDRSTLYALRGVIQAGFTREALPRLLEYSRKRLLGEHVPYAIEAWPEGNQRHLSAESALYARIFTEGLFGIRPTGLRSFELKPRLPEGWDNMALRDIRAFGSGFDVEIASAPGNKIMVKVTSDGKTIMKKKVKRGATVTVEL